jgi:hypothetical protein
MPGQCFPFKGDHGSVVIRLAVPVVPTEFVLEHLSKSISIVGHINSAPNNFTVYVSRKIKMIERNNLFFCCHIGIER